MTQALSLAEKLHLGLIELGLDLSSRQQEQLTQYLTMILKWNKVYNLTAIKSEDGALTHHLLDSLAVIKPLQKHLTSLGGAASSKPRRVLDVGAGAGLPGVVVAICCPDVAVVCVDTVGKKAAFIQQVAVTLELANLQGIHARVEQLPVAIRANGFDVMTSRAFATLADFVRLTRDLPTERTGAWMAMKAKTANAEAVDLPVDVRVFHVEPLHVPNLNEERCLVWMRPN